jgi:hypothetical protein
MLKFTPAAEGHGLWPWMNAPMFGRDVAPLGREAGCHGLCPWGSTWFAALRFNLLFHGYFGEVHGADRDFRCSARL